MMFKFLIYHWNILNLKSKKLISNEQNSNFVNFENIIPNEYWGLRGKAIQNRFYAF